MAVDKKTHIKLLEETFKVSPTDIVDKKLYQHGGTRQSKRKTEYIEYANRIAKERGIPAYDPDHIALELEVGVPLGQRYLEPVKISGTDVMCEYEDLHIMNNVAIEQMVDDIFRTAIVCIDLPHKVLVDRYGFEVTPESINTYLETINHTMVGGAVTQEHMCEMHPGPCADGYVKIFTGNDEVASSLDSRFVIDINKEFTPEKAAKLKEGVGDSLWQVSRVPTHALRTMDGAIIHRWNAMGQTMAFIASYHLCAGEAAISDFAYAAKHAQYIWMGTPPFVSKARGHNSVVGLPVGYIFDIIQHESAMPDDPIPVSAEGLAMESILYFALYYGQMMIGTVGVTVAPATFYVNELYESRGAHLVDWIKDKYGGIAQAPMNWDTIHDCTDEATMAAIEEYDTYPLLPEHHWGLIQAVQISLISSACAAWATGKPMAGALAAHYCMSFVQKEALMRTGWGGQESTHHPAMPAMTSVLLDEGLPVELTGINVPFRSPFADSQHYTSHSVVAAHEARMDAWALSPIVKVAFADPHLPFNFRNVRESVAKGALREFEPAGERDVLRPTK
ncbi:MAG: methyl coenzyme M reductase subunit alpha [Candidatus Syntrophoarchaeum caldarius]|uniref:coenzyme-B sulfoethylthiotransferase n=1 Tax=Candidatus Syntropharchaeum caldarium TaxID=1838285 RepID=A0A1F2P9A1_9EURY|nr:MAG: methyl coenzyme M reductase subunit alpha [Candidatus Syntrophoarchaeum caldarius]